MPCPYKDSAHTLYNEPSDKVGVIKVLVKLSDKIKDLRPLISVQPLTYHIHLPLLILFYSSHLKYVHLNFKKIVNKPITDKSRNLLPIVKYVSSYHYSKKNLKLDINCQSFESLNVSLFSLISLYFFFLTFTYFIFCFSIVVII